MHYKGNWGPVLLTVAVQAYPWRSFFCFKGIDSSRVPGKCRVATGVRDGRKPAVWASVDISRPVCAGVSSNCGKMRTRHRRMRWEAEILLME